MQTCFFPPSEPPGIVNAGPKIYVLFGLGGAGKSQVAFEFVRLHLDRFSQSYFVDASSQRTLENSMSNIVADKAINPTALQAKHWLESEREIWIILFDNADDPHINYRQYLPQSMYGKIIITSRNEEMRQFGPRSNSNISSMSKTEAVGLLLSAVQLDVADDGTSQLASRLVEELGCLALAVMQAGAYISHSCPLKDYLTMYEKRKAKLWDQKVGQSPDDYAYTVYTTWDISISALDPIAVDFIRVCSFFHNIGIPKDLFQKAFCICKNLRSTQSASTAEAKSTPQGNLPAFEKGHIDRYTRQFLDTFEDPDGDWDLLKFNQMLENLRQHSMISGSRLKTGIEDISYHKLVHEWTRSRIPPLETDQYWKIALELLAHVSRRSDTDAVPLRFTHTLVSHIDNFLSMIETELGPWEDILIFYLECFRLALRLLNNWPIIVKLVRLVITFGKALAPNDPDMLQSRCRLVESLSEVGDTSEAEAIALDVSQKCIENEKIGPTHDLTLRCLDDLAKILGDRGRWKDCAIIQWQNFEIKASTRGREIHLRTMSNLAVTLTTLGDSLCAEAMCLVCFYLRYQGWKQGIDKESVMLTDMGTLAQILDRSGDKSRRLISFDIHLRVIRRYRTIAGHQDPTSLKTVSPFSILCYHLRKYELAEAALLMILELIPAIDGETSERAFETRSTLAAVYVKQGKISLAISEYKKLSNDIIKAGAYRFLSLLAMVLENLGVLYEKCQLPVQASSVYKEGIHRCQALSEKDPKYARIMKRLLLLQESGCSVPAENVFDQTQPEADEERYTPEDIERLFSEEHNKDQTYLELLETVMSLRPDIVEIIHDSHNDKQLLFANLFKYLKRIYDESLDPKPTGSSSTDSSELGLIKRLNDTLNDIYGEGVARKTTVSSDLGLPPSETRPLPLIEK